ncbi:hypothetical protein ACP3TY_06010 [Pseudomonas rustica]|uniref:hypothetical protein n=1 Tax=Pseudomonas rustica TaxID=2827099 RepID=UPI003CF16244
MSADFSFIPLLTGVVGAVLGVWITISRTKYTAYSADFSKRMEQLTALVDKLGECACRYWIKDVSDKLKVEADYILGLRSSLSVAIDALNKDYKGFNGKQILDAFGKFNTACTGHNFPSREMEPGHPAPLAEILNTAENLKCEILRARKNNYRWRDAVRNPKA